MLDDRYAPSNTYVRGVERLMEALGQLSAARELTQIQAIVPAAARELVGSDGAALLLREGKLCFCAAEDAIAPLWAGTRFPIEASVSGWSMLNRAVVAIEDVYEDRRVPHAAFRPTFVKSLLMVPIRSRDPIGAIGSYWADGHVATDSEIKLLQALAEATSVAWSNLAMRDDLEQRVLARTAALERVNSEIHHLSMTDELTGLLNRRGFFGAADQRLAEARLAGNDCIVAFVDIDGLKQVNDTYGHMAGDAMIAHLADSLRSVVREGDLIARLGGDEFCTLVIAPPEGGTDLAARLRERLDRLNESGALEFTLSASVGLVSTAEVPGASVDELLLQADQRMYTHKRARRPLP